LHTILETAVGITGLISKRDQITISRIHITLQAGLKTLQQAAMALRGIRKPRPEKSDFAISNLQ